MTTFIACDGSCIQEGTYRMGDDTDRPSAAAIVIKDKDGDILTRSIPFKNSTIGKMEVFGILMALRYVAQQISRGDTGPFHISCDSQYAVNGYNQWLAGWAAKGYHKKGGLANADLWREIDEIKSQVSSYVQVVWVKGHAGDELNELADQAANTAARTQEGVGTIKLDPPVESAPEYDPAKFDDFIDWLRDLEGGLPKEAKIELMNKLDLFRAEIEKDR